MSRLDFGIALLAINAKIKFGRGTIVLGDFELSRRFLVLIFLAILGTDAWEARAGAGWKAGVARAKITPEKSMWMSGYGSRDKVAEGTLIDLWAKALVLEDEKGTRVVLISLDLVGIDRDFSIAVRGRLESEFGLKRESVSLCCSHTHCGPVVGRNLAPMYFLDEANQALVREYTTNLEKHIVATVKEALANLAPCRVTSGAGQASFAVNRRTNPEVEVPELRLRGKLRGPVDHDVPVLAIRDLDDRLVAVAFGYACHATVMSFYQWSGDYPGFAQLDLEQAHPGMTALFWAGCGADQNPLPRREVEHARQYGGQLAQAVERTLSGPMAAVPADVVAKYVEIPLPLGKLPTLQELDDQAKSSDRFVAARARRLLAQIADGQPLSSTYPYPIQSWNFGAELRWVHLGGEVVIDFANRLKRELGRERTWVAGYANDVMAYIPSRRVLEEGGYEGASAMVYYGLPTSWAPAVEEDIVRAVHESTLPKATSP